MRTRLLWYIVDLAELEGAMNLTEYDELVFKATVIHQVSARLGLADSAMLASSELLPLIHSRSGEAEAALIAFLDAHQRWSDFHLKINREGRAGYLGDFERAEL